MYIVCFVAHYIENAIHISHIRHSVYKHMGTAVVNISGNVPTGDVKS